MASHWKFVLWRLYKQINFVKVGCSGFFRTTTKRNEMFNLNLKKHIKANTIQHSEYHIDRRLFRRNVQSMSPIFFSFHFFFASCSLSSCLPNNNTKKKKKKLFFLKCLSSSPHRTSEDSLSHFRSFRSSYNEIQIRYTEWL